MPWRRAKAEGPATQDIHCFYVLNTPYYVKINQSFFSFNFKVTVSYDLSGVSSSSFVGGREKHPDNILEIINAI